MVVVVGGGAVVLFPIESGPPARGQGEARPGQPDRRAVRPGRTGQLEQQRETVREAAAADRGRGAAGARPEHSASAANSRRRAGPRAVTANPAPRSRWARAPGHAMAQGPRSRRTRRRYAASSARRGVGPRLAAAAARP